MHHVLFLQSTRIQCIIQLDFQFSVILTHWSSLLMIKSHFDSLFQPPNDQVSTVILFYCVSILFTATAFFLIITYKIFNIFLDYFNFKGEFILEPDFMMKMMMMMMIIIIIIMIIIIIIIIIIIVIIIIRIYCSDLRPK